MVRAGRLYRQGCGFKSRCWYKKKDKKMKDKNTTRLVLQGSFESTKDRMLKDSYAQASLFGSLKKFLKKKNKSGDSDITPSVLSSSDNVN